MKLLTTTLALSALALGLSACGGGGSSTPSPRGTSTPSAQSYIQFERLARPAVKELTERFVDHQISNGVEPYNDPTLLDPNTGAIATFANHFRASGYGPAIAGVLSPDELKIDLSQTGPGGYFGVETGGKIGGPFGGRLLTDDVIDDSLAVFFGNALSSLGLLADDHQENNCLSKQNVTQKSSQYQAAFPYVAAPH
jgi:hypothetical protein